LPFRLRVPVLRPPPMPLPSAEGSPLPLLLPLPLPLPVLPSMSPPLEEDKTGRDGAEQVESNESWRLKVAVSHYVEDRTGG
jgi:hypothetical protein